jgi:hypothetical protein
MTEGMYYAFGCNGSGVTGITYLGDKTSHLNIDGQTGAPSAFGRLLSLDPLHRGRPPFMPLQGIYYDVRDDLDRRGDRT